MRPLETVIIKTALFTSALAWGAAGALFLDE